MNKKWSTLLREAFKKKSQSQQYLRDAVVTLMKQKGFPDDIAVMFDCDFAGGNETVIKFNNDGEMCDLDLRIVSGMNKEEIISQMERHLSDENKRLIHGEVID